MLVVAARCREPEASLDGGDDGGDDDGRAIKVLLFMRLANPIRSGCVRRIGYPLK